MSILHGFAMFGNRRKRWLDDACVTIGRANFCNDRGTFSRLRIVAMAQWLSRVFRAHHESVAAKISKAGRDASWRSVARDDCFAAGSRQSATRAGAKRRARNAVGLGHRRAMRPT
ncbi:hypothetical protein ACE10Z_23180 [Bradyrhizobium sp. Pha-3]|uniref:hypothetical protein n=1 Tax=Bradyrhizobium sp. Pha-3 TaxID=208375 RepID=UPI0035D4A69D